jgi:hypothetical protein
MLFDLTRGGGRSFIDVKGLLNPDGGAGPNGAKVSPVDQRKFGIIRCMTRS